MLANCNSWLAYNVHDSLRLRSGQAGLTTNGSLLVVRSETSKGSDRRCRLGIIP